MLNCFYYWKTKDRLTLSYIYSFKNILTYVETAIATWCYSSTYPKDTLANYVS